ncbi:MAG: tRNA pseudouridine(55) synthase TruB [Bacilli bacterium]|nr:tRNA pseudouridine(55) synthase TruB [Bacilli bacterium]MBQ8472089.1 tRNA pseudouridine(55) synthase TruB [Bacilli bacterium]
MDGIINVYKTKGMTSHDVVNKVRRIFNTKQVGHTGTLDPNAEGVLVVCVNSATKLVQFLEADVKKYKAELIIGISTDTYDITGNIVEEVKDFKVDKKRLYEVIDSFKGPQLQMPPIYSAIKVNGKKLYDYALKNQEVKIEPRSIEIFDIKIVSDLIKDADYYKLEFEVTVSKGTYIRSICHDIGVNLGIPCTMGNLLRLQSGAFKIEDASTLEEIENGNYQITDMVSAISSYEKIDLTNNEEVLYKVNNGMKISLKSFDKKYSNFVAVKGNQLLAVYEYFEEEKYKYYRAVRVWK